MTIFSKTVGGPWPLWPPLATRMCLELVIDGSWDYSGHFAAGFKWLPFQLIYLNFRGTFKYPHGHTH